MTLRDTYAEECNKAKVTTHRKLCLITSMSSRNCDMIWRFHGRSETQVAIAKKFKISSQRVGQIIATGLRRLKLYNKNGKFKGVD